MAKKILIICVSFILGFFVAYFTQTIFRKIIQNIFEWSTFNVIALQGEDYYPNTIEPYFIFFGIPFAIFTVSSQKSITNKIFINLIFSLFIFSLSLIILTIIDANVKTIEPTNFEKGIVKWSRNSIVYNTPLAICIILAIAPHLFKMLKKR
ncbi:hypothetical protein [Bizionia paragorgiae]|uniref:hypothetical protein n=1 Tax=Bizionia paragorgiae TaxID=283786 RepID=UPI00299F3CB3|nr:hypothetical protein [Bizionia paragorgiae]MDX1272279.1 hypothetical protein [Bizionia paragorgiae]